jgi:hypothetical protein
LAELGRHYDSLNEGVIRAVEIAAAAAFFARANDALSGRPARFATYSCAREPLRAPTSGAIMKFGTHWQDIAVTRQVALTKVALTKEAPHERRRD